MWSGTCASDIPRIKMRIGVEDTTCREPAQPDLMRPFFGNFWNAVYRRARGTPLTEFAKLHRKVDAVFAYSERWTIFYLARR
jgi:hypothetical protein